MDNIQETEESEDEVTQVEDTKVRLIAYKFNNQIRFAIATSIDPGQTRLCVGWPTSKFSS